MKNRIKRCWGCDHLEFVVSDMSWLCPKTGREFSKRSEAERQTACSHWKELEEEPIIWTMCPYCEDEVEVYEAEEVQCPNCGATFTLSEEDIELAKEAWEEQKR
jgi:predicted RNA-binding Zn-ribbon protein involved in translation (DUF1610 family)